MSDLILRRAERELAISFDVHDQARLLVQQIRADLVDRREVELRGWIEGDHAARLALDLPLDVVDWERVRFLCSPEELGRIDAATGIRFCWVPPGVAILGTDASDTRSYEDERPAMRVKFREGFYLAELPVSERQWADVIGGDTSASSGDLPRVNISWDDCRKFCSRAGMSLPTEDAWEYAARGVDGRTFPWGEQDPPADRQRGWAPVSHAGPFGHLGLAGNVWSWCADTWDARRHHGHTGPERDGDVPFEPAPTACAGAAAGTTSPGAVARRTATGSTPASGTPTSGFGPPGGDPDPTMARPTACAGAAAGTTAPGSVARRSATGSTPAAGTPASGFVPLGGDPDPTMARPCASAEAAAGATTPSSAARPTATGSGRAAGSTTSGSAPPGGDSDPTMARPTACTGAAAGATTPGTVARRTASGSTPATGSPPSGFGPPGAERDGDSDPSACTGAVAGTTSPGSVARRTATGTTPATGTPTSGFGPPKVWGSAHDWPIARVIEWATSGKGQTELFASSPEDAGCMRWGLCDSG